MPFVMDKSKSKNGALVSEEKACVKQTLSSRPKIGLQYQLSLNVGQKYFDLY